MEFGGPPAGLLGVDFDGSQGAGRLVEGGEDARVVRVLGQLGWGCGEPVGEARSAGPRLQGLGVQIATGTDRFGHPKTLAVTEDTQFVGHGIGADGAHDDA